METKEIFKDIPGYEGYYQASNMGNVRSADRTAVDSMGRKRFYRGRILKGGINKTTGYRQFTLSVNGKYRTFNASQIAAITYLNHTPDGHQLVIDHINGDRSDDRVCNLRIVTHRKNTSTCFRKDRSSLSSKFTGVNWHKPNNKWRAHIRYEGKDTHLGYYSTEIDASNAYQKALGEINNNSFNPDDYKPNFASKFKGIYFNKASNKWQSQIRVNKKYKHVGYFNTEIEAYQALQKFKQKQPLSI